MSRYNPNGISPKEYRRLKRELSNSPVNKATAKRLGWGQTTIALVKKSTSIDHYHELRRISRQKRSVKQVNEEADATVTVELLGGRKRKVSVVNQGKLYGEDDMVVVPAALFEALSDQMTELYDELRKANRVWESPTFITTHQGEPIEEPHVSFRQRFVEKFNEIKRRSKKNGDK